MRWFFNVVTWEQRKLKDTANFAKGIGYSKKDLKSSGIPIILYGRLYTKYETVINEIDTFTQPKKDTFLSKGGEIIVPASGETAEDISVASVVKNKGIILGGDLNIVYPNSSLNSVFLALNITYGRAHDEMRRRAQGKTIVHLHNSDLANIKLKIPTISEQKKIVYLLEKINKLIALQQRKLDRLLLLKKAYLTNLLPDKTQNPKVRFKEFNDKWKKLKLGNISSISAGGDVNKQKLLKKGRYPVIANALTNKGVIGYYESKYRIQAPAVTVTGRGDIGHAYARKTNFTPVVRLLSIKSKHNVDFLAEAINQKKVPFESTGVPQLTVPKLSNYKILFPSSITEENKIGNFIIKFDEIINLQNKKISSLEQVKNFLLQNMFI